METFIIQNLDSIRDLSNHEIRLLLVLAYFNFSKDRLPDLNPFDTINKYYKYIILGDENAEFEEL